MANVVGVRFKKAGKIYYFDPAGNNLNYGDKVIVETIRGVEFGEVVVPQKQVKDDEVVLPLKPVIRVAGEDDIKHHEKNRQKEKEAFDICLKKINEYGLGMKLIDVEYTFDNNKILFYFTADGRVDFRELVKDLASIFKTRIELRQVGVRDESKILGGLGVCGRVLCCKAHLGDFQPVSIKMAKEQGLSLNPTKISGTCGRLMCCLKYEQEAYEELIDKVPGIGSIVETELGQGTVVEMNLIKELIKVKLNDNDDNSADLLVCKANQVKVITHACDMVSEDEDIEGLKDILD